MPSDDYLKALAVLKENRDGYHAALDEFKKLSDRASELRTFKGVRDRHLNNPSTTPMLLADLLKCPMPEIADPAQRLAECERRAQEYETAKTALEAVIGWLMKMNITVLTPLGLHFGLGTPNDFSALNRDVRAASEIAMSLRVFYDTLTGPFLRRHPIREEARKPLVGLQEDVWKILEKRTARYDRHGMPRECLTGDQIADELAKAHIRNQDGKRIGDVIGAIRAKGWTIRNQPGQGYYIPKASSELSEASRK